MVIITREILKYWRKICTYILYLEYGVRRTARILIDKILLRAKRSAISQHVYGRALLWPWLSLEVAAGVAALELGSHSSQKEFAGVRSLIRAGEDSSLPSTSVRTLTDVLLRNQF